MWESKAWIVLERFIGYLTIAFLVFAVWKTLLEVKTDQAKQSKKVNATLEAIREKMGDEEAWQRLKQPLESKMQRP